MIVDPFFYLAAIPAVILMGVAKGGFAGLGGLAVPILALAISPVQGAAIILPLMIVQDVVGVWAYRSTWDGWILAVTLPGVPVGIFLGYLVARHTSIEAVMFVLGAISILFALYRLRVERAGPIAASPRAPAWVGTLLGVGSGFTSQIALNGSPPFQMFILPRRLEANVMVGTTAIFFAVNNVLKLPAFFALGQFTPSNMRTSLALLPLAILSTFAGVGLMRRIDADRFYTLIYYLLALVGVGLIWRALS